MLKQSSEALWDAYDLAMLDLDGVVYIGPAAVPGAAAALQKALAAGMQLAYVTNNASRPPGVVADHLRDLGVPVEDGHVVTSAQAAARLLADELEPGSKVFVIGGRGLFEALLDEGLVPVQSTDDAPVAVASGYDADLRWRTVTEGAILVKQGLFWVASNMDISVPTARGHGPGNGVLVEAVAGFAGRRPVVAGKPLPPLFEETRRRVGGDRPLVVGDRLDTDIEGANNTGLDSLLVMTGVTGLPELASATPGAASVVRLGGPRRARLRARRARARRGGVRARRLAGPGARRRGRRRGQREHGRLVARGRADRVAASRHHGRPGGDLRAAAAGVALAGGDRRSAARERSRTGQDHGGKG